VPFREFPVKPAVVRDRRFVDERRHRCFVDPVSRDHLVGYAGEGEGAPYPLRQPRGIEKAVDPRAFRGYRCDPIAVAVIRLKIDLALGCALRLTSDVCGPPPSQSGAAREITPPGRTEPDRLSNVLLD